MNYSIHRISLDIHKVGSQAVLNVKKGDTARSICITLMENGKPYEIFENCSAVFSAKKPDGNYILNDCIIQDNKLVYNFTPQTAPVAGAMECEVSLYDESGNQITSPRFLIVVDEIVYNGEEIVSSSEANVLKELIEEASDTTARAEEAAEEAVNFAKLASDAADNANEAAASASGVKEEMYELLGRKPLNLLDSNNIKKWTVKRQSSSSSYSMFAGAVDLTDCELDGITGVLSLVQTYASDANYVDFEYRDTINLGDEFSILLTTFMKTNIDKTEDNNPTKDSYIKLNLGDCNITLVRKAEDASSETAWDRCNFRASIGCMVYRDDKPYEYISTDSELIPSNITTSLYNSDPTTEIKLQPNGIANTKIIDNSLSKNGNKSAYTLAYTKKSGWKDIIISFKNRVMKIEDCEGNILCSQKLPVELSFKYIRPSVRIYSDSILMRPHTSDVFRLEISSPQINNIHTHKNFDLLNSITEEGMNKLGQAFAEFNMHKMDTNNPHNVTATQIGVYTIDETDERIKKAVATLSGGDIDLSNYVTQEELVPISEKADAAYNQSDTALTAVGTFDDRIKALENSNTDLSNYATTEQLNEVDGKAGAALDAASNVESRIDEACGMANDAFSMAETAINEVGHVGDFATAFYFANDVLTDTLLIYVETVENETHFKSYIVNSSTTNVPVEDSTFRGIRHPINILRHSADNIDYVVKITELTPVLGRQWINYYSTDSGSWHGWIEV